MGMPVEAPTALPEDHSSNPSTTRVPEGSNTLFWPPQASGMHVVRIDTRRRHLLVFRHLTGYILNYSHSAPPVHIR